MTKKGIFFKLRGKKVTKRDRADILRFVSVRGFAASTAAAYERVLLLIAGEHDLATISGGDMREFLDGQSWGAAMRWQALSALRSFVIWRYGEGHPVLGLRLKRTQSLPQRVLDMEQVAGLLASFDTGTAKGVRDLALCALLLDTGLRSSEVCRLELRHVDLERRSLQVLIKGGRLGSGVFSEYTAACLVNWVAVRANIAAQGERALFVGIWGITPGRRMTPGGLRATMRRWAREAGLDALSPHDLRRTFATMATRLGAPSRVVQEAGRWSNLAMVERYTRAISADDMGPWFPVAAAMGQEDS